MSYMLGDENGGWYSDQHFHINDKGRIISNFTQKEVGIYTAKKPSINYMLLGYGRKLQNDLGNTNLWNRVKAALWTL